MLQINEYEQNYQAIRMPNCQTEKAAGNLRLETIYQYRSYSLDIERAKSLVITSLYFTVIMAHI